MQLILSHKFIKKGKPIELFQMSIATLIYVQMSESVNFYEMIIYTWELRPELITGKIIRIWLSAVDGAVGYPTTMVTGLFTITLQGAITSHSIEQMR